jgi:hypothetical protein
MPIGVLTLVGHHWDAVDVGQGSTAVTEQLLTDGSGKGVPVAVPIRVR